MNNLRPILVVGTGRCGTLTVAEYLQQAGLDVGHEKEGADGIVAWYRAFDTEVDPWGRPVEKRVYKTTLHVIREPLATIASWAFTVSNKSIRYVGARLNLPQGWSRVRKSLAHWVMWNDRCEELSSWSFRVEDLSSRHTHQRQHRSVTWTDLVDCDAELAEAARKKAEKFGYI